MIEEKYEFTSGAKKALLITIVAGVVLAIVGLLINMSGGDHGGDHGAGHGTEVVADHGGGHETAAADSHGEEGGHHGPAIWLKRLFVNLWINNIFFTGIALIGVFWVAVNHVANAGWSASIVRVMFSLGRFLPISFNVSILLIS